MTHFLTDFHFLRPGWLLALLPLAILWWALRRRRSGADDWRGACDPALLPHVLIGAPAPSTRRSGWLSALAGTLAVLALAGPAWERLPAPAFRNLSALVVVLDLSIAMDATDLKPSRMAWARFKVEDILQARKDGQTALVVYAGDAFTVTPLTDDAATIAAQLSALGPKLMPIQGARVDLGLEAAARLLRQAGLRTGDVLLVTTGEGLAGAESKAARLQADGYRVSVLGVGTPEGAPVPLPEGGFLKDERGAIVIPRLDTSALARLAEAGGGLYRTLEPGSEGLEALLRFVDRRAGAAPQAGQSVQVDQWREHGVFLLPLLLPLGALAFRRGWLGLWLLIALAPLPKPAMALSWQDLWLTPDQQAQRDFRAGNPNRAAERFQNPEWKAAAEYKAGRYEQAAKDLEQFDTAAGHYNRGNALANQGRLKEALKAYDRALELNPNDEDAKYNRKLVEDVLRQQEEEQKKQESQDQEKAEGGDQGQQPQPAQAPRNGQKPPPEQGQSGEPGQRPQDQPKQAEGSDHASAHRPDAGQSGEQDHHESSAQESGGDAGENRPAPGEGEPSGPPEPKAPIPKADAPAQAAPEGQAKPGDKAESESVPADAEPSPEARQAEEQWLRRIPDDPGGLLKRKFYYQYRQRQQQQDSEREPW